MLRSLVGSEMCIRDSYATEDDTEVLQLLQPPDGSKFDEPVDLAPFQKDLHSAIQDNPTPMHVVETEVVANPSKTRWHAGELQVYLTASNAANAAMHSMDKTSPDTLSPFWDRSRSHTWSGWFYVTQEPDLFHWIRHNNPKILGSFAKFKRALQPMV